MKNHPYPPIPLQNFHGSHPRAGNNVHKLTANFRDPMQLSNAYDSIAFGPCLKRAVAQPAKLAAALDELLKDVPPVTQEYYADVSYLVNRTQKPFQSISFVPQPATPADENANECNPT